MCQLTLLRAKNLTLLRALLANQLLVNTKTTHRDGVGIAYYDDKDERYFLRSRTAPILNASFYDESILPIDSAKYPVLAHVRKASTKKETQLEQHVHPFYDEETNLTLAHNGTLEFLDTARQADVDNEFPDMIDSQIFFKLFSERFKKDEDVVKSLKDTMELFSGKFAFLIRHGLDFYAVRGKTAELHVAKIYKKSGDTLKQIAMLVNTELLPLKESLGYTLVALRGSSEGFKYTIEELEKESIYKLESNYDLVKVDEITQNFPYQNSYNRGRNYTAQKRESGGALDVLGLPLVTPRQGSTTTDATLTVLNQTCNRLGITLYELDELLFATLSLTLAEVTTTDVRDFNLWISPLLEQIIEDDENTHEKRSLWLKSVARLGLWNRSVAYGKVTPNLQFPWYFNEVEELRLLEQYTEKLTQNRKEAE